MESPKIHIYLVPGLAASTQIFEHIHLDANRFQLHYLDWLVPESKKEPLEHYVERMCSRIREPDPVLIGVSFGGIVVQEMSKKIATKKTIIISSIKSNKELPIRLKLARFTGAYKLFPVKVFINIENFSKFAVGKTLKHRIKLYEKYLSMRDTYYMPWAIYNVLHWKPTGTLTDVVHIHGNNDFVFPIRHIKDCEIVKGGTHVMIINKANYLSSILEKII